MKIPEEAYLLILNKYQRDNLIWLIQMCGMPGGRFQVEPFQMANTGDWIGEIYWMLEPGDGEVSPPDSNKSHEEVRKAISESLTNWIADQSR